MKKLLLTILVIVFFGVYSVLNKQSKSSPATSSSNSVSMQNTNGNYKDGEYIGNLTDAYYGNVQVKAVIQDGKISDIQFLEYPQDRRTSIEINDQAIPKLRSEAIKSQSATVDAVSGATQTSLAFVQSLQTALDQAQK